MKRQQSGSRLIIGIVLIVFLLCLNWYVDLLSLRFSRMLLDSVPSLGVDI